MTRSYPTRWGQVSSRILPDHPFAKHNISYYTALHKMKCDINFQSTIIFKQKLSKYHKDEYFANFKLSTVCQLGQPICNLS